VACPYFYPVERVDDGTWIKPPRLPLGAPYRGFCQSVDGQRFEPDARGVRECCNTGYARGRCARFPDRAPADALRFSIEADANGVIEIVFIFEAAWSPARFGRAQWSEGAIRCEEALDPVLRRQMEIFISNYLEHRSRPAHA
jgi:hypothetical protein